MAQVELTSLEELTISEYGRVAQLWVSAHTTQQFWSPEFDIFESLLPPKSSMVEFGSGGGRDAPRLAQKYRYLGTDRSPELIQVARKNNPELSFQQENIYRMSFLADSFGGFWCSATLLHLPKNRIGEALREMHRVTKPDGIGFISLKEGYGQKIERDILFDESGEEIHYDRFVARYQESEFASILTENHFNIIDDKSYVKPVGNTRWLIFFVKNK